MLKTIEQGKRSNTLPSDPVLAIFYVPLQMGYLPFQGPFCAPGGWPLQAASPHSSAEAPVGFSYGLLHPWPLGIGVGTAPSW